MGAVGAAGAVGAVGTILKVFFTEGLFICGADKRDQEILDCSEKLESA